MSHYINICHFSKEKSSLKFFFLNHKLFIEMMRTKRPAHPRRQHSSFMNEGEKKKVFPFVFRSHPSTNNLHSSLCQTHTMNLIPPNARDSITRSICHFSANQIFLSPVFLLFSWQRKFSADCERNRNRYDVSSSCVCCARLVNKGEGNEFIFHSHLTFIALTRDEGTVKKGFVFCASSRKASDIKPALCNQLSCCCASSQGKERKVQRKP